MSIVPRRPMGSRLEVSDLAVAYRSPEGETQAVRGLSFAVRPGEIVALVGQSGCGKTSAAQAIVGLLPADGRLTHGEIRLGGSDISRMTQKQLSALRSARVCFLPQDAASSLNPVMPIGKQIAQAMRIHERMRSAIAEAQALALLARVGLSQPGLRAKQYPHELSGGMRQRVLIALAFAMRPEVIVADEPAGTLDIAARNRILDLIDDLRRTHGTAVLLATHDLRLAADRADRIIVLQNGEIRDQSAAADILAAPHDGQKQLLADVLPRPAIAKAADDALVVERLTQDFAVERGQALRALDNVSLTVRRGTTHAIVGDSGSGKTTIARNVVGLLRPTSGRILVDGADWTNLSRESLRQFHRKIQLVYQDPYNSLDPRRTIFDIVEEPLLNFGLGDKAERADKVTGLIERVGLSSAFHERTPPALSSGQRLRIAIARALVLDPQILVFDEAVSTLEISVQVDILNLLDELQHALGLSYLFASHDLAAARRIADTISVLHNGRMIESGAAEDVFARLAGPHARAPLDTIQGEDGLSTHHKDAAEPKLPLDNASAAAAARAAL